MCVSTSDCGVPDWRQRARETVLGALREHAFTANSEQGCLDGCFNDRMCVGVDVDFTVSPMLCWKHFNPTNYYELNIYSQQTTNSYQLLSRCRQGEATTTSSTGQ